MAEEQKLESTPPVEGSSLQNNESQVTPPASQEVVEPQNTGSVAVENGNAETPIASDPRPKVSDFYDSRKAFKEVKQLRGELRQAVDFIKQLQSQPKSGSDTNAKKEMSAEEMNQAFIADPIGFVRKMQEEGFQRATSEFNKKLESLDSDREQRQKLSSLQSEAKEAAKMLFPTDSSMPEVESIEELTSMFPKRAAEIDVIVKEYPGLDMAIGVAPKAIAKAILDLRDYKILKAKGNLNAIPKKQQLVTPNTGISPNDSAMSLKQIQSEQEKLDAEVDKDPTMRRDEKWLDKKKKLDDALLRRYKELKQAAA